MKLLKNLIIVALPFFLIACGDLRETQSELKSTNPLVNKAKKDPIFFLGQWDNDVNSVSFDLLRIEFMLDEEMRLVFRSTKRYRKDQSFTPYKYNNHVETLKMIEDNLILINENSFSFKPAKKDLLRVTPKTKVTILECSESTPNISFHDNDHSDLVAWTAPENMTCKELKEEKIFVADIISVVDVVGGAAALTLKVPACYPYNGAVIFVAGLTRWSLNRMSIHIEKLLLEKCESKQKVKTVAANNKSMSQHICEMKNGYSSMQFSWLPPSNSAIHGRCASKK